VVEIYHATAINLDTGEKGGARRQTELGAPVKFGGHHGTKSATDLLQSGLSGVDQRRTDLEPARCLDVRLEKGRSDQHGDRENTQRREARVKPGTLPALRWEIRELRAQRRCLAFLFAANVAWLPHGKGDGRNMLSSAPLNLVSSLRSPRVPLPRVVGP